MKTLYQSPLKSLATLGGLGAAIIAGTASAQPAPIRYPVGGVVTTTGDLDARVNVGAAVRRLESVATTNMQDTTTSFSFAEAFAHRLKRTRVFGMFEGCQFRLSADADSRLVAPTGFTYEVDGSVSQLRVDMDWIRLHEAGVEVLTPGPAGGATASASFTTWNTDPAADGNAIQMEIPFVAPGNGSSITVLPLDTFLKRTDNGDAIGSSELTWSVHADLNANGLVDDNEPAIRTETLAVSTGGGTVDQASPDSWNVGRGFYVAKLVFSSDSMVVASKDSCEGPPEFADGATDDEIQFTLRFVDL